MTKLKRVTGAIAEFDLLSIGDGVTNMQVRKAMHLSFATGIGVGILLARDASKAAGVETDCFDLNRFKASMNDYANQVMKAQSEIEL